MVAHFLALAHVYCERREARLAIGLFQSMESNNSIICVISETVCLENLKSSGGIEHILLYTCVTALSDVPNQSNLEFKSNSPYFLDGTIVLKLFLGNITVVFQIATKIYLYSVIEESTLRTSTVMLKTINKIGIIYIGTKKIFMLASLIANCTRLLS